MDLRIFMSFPLCLCCFVPSPLLFTAFQIFSGRLFIYATFGAAAEMPALSDRVFQAYPPGARPDEAALKRFYAAVQEL